MTRLLFNIDFLVYLMMATIATTVTGFGIRPEFNAPSHMASDLASSVLQQRQSSPPLALDAPPSPEELNWVEFVSAQELKKPLDSEATDENSVYPLAGMLRGSARYIADHRKETAVFYIPGDVLLGDKEYANKLLGDIALSWMLGLKIVIVVGCRFDVDCCQLEFRNQHECHHTLRVTDDEMLRRVSEEAGFVRFEVERILNRHLRLHAGVSNADGGHDDAPALNGNVVGGNFYVARGFGTIDGVDYKNTGHPSKVYTEKIQQALNDNDIVLLTTAGTSRLGDLVNVNGNHLAAKVAASLQSRKLVIMSNSDSVLLRKGASKTMQEIPLSFTKALLNHYKIKFDQGGIASFEEAKQSLPPSAVELLLHLGWSSWAIDQGVNRAHIVNPGDGSLLEELFTSKLGVNTCVYHEDETENWDIDDDADFFA